MEENLSRRNFHNKHFIFSPRAHPFDSYAPGCRRRQTASTHATPRTRISADILHSLFLPLKKTAHNFKTATTIFSFSGVFSPFSFSVLWVVTLCGKRRNVLSFGINASVLSCSLQFYTTSCHTHTECYKLALELRFILCKMCFSDSKHPERAGIACRLEKN